MGTFIGPLRINTITRFTPTKLLTMTVRGIAGTLGVGVSCWECTTYVQYSSRSIYDRVKRPIAEQL